MGKWRNILMAGCDEPQQQDSPLSLPLPPPPPLLPRPGLMATTSLDYDDDQDLEPGDLDLSEPLDYSMKRLQQQHQQQQQQQQQGCSGRSSHCSNSSSGSSRDSGAVLHKLRHTVLHRQPSQKQHQFRPSQQQQQLLQFFQYSPKHLQAALLTAAASSALPKSQPRESPAASAAAASAEDTEGKAAYAAECIKSRLDGCGKRVHLFLGILLHFGMPPGRHGEVIFDRVIAFSDEHKNPSEKPTAHFMVLDSKLLALIWCKFKGNSSNEYSTLTRAIRSTRQKYKGIFEAVENPGKKLYKFGPVALQQFRQLFPSSYNGDLEN